MSPTINRIGSEGFVVVEDGKRVNEQAFQDPKLAEEAAAQLRKKLLEQQGQPAPAVEVSQQLFG